MTRRSNHGFQRRQIYADGQRSCFWCGMVLEPYEATLDHIVPLASGGRDVPENMTIACECCNQIRGLLQQVIRGKVKCPTKNSLRQADGWMRRFAGKDAWLAGGGRIEIVREWIEKKKE